MFKNHPFLLEQAGDVSTEGAAPEAKPVAVTYNVWDTLASSGQVRTHQIVTKTYADGREPDIVTYKLSSDGDGTPMPVDHALKFLSDQAFVVKNPLGERIEPPAKAEGGLGAFNMKVDQTIAYYHELSKPALYKRCKLSPEGDRIQVGDTTEDMINFLIAAETKRRHQTDQGADDAQVKFNQGDLGGAAPVQVVERMFA